MRRHRPRLQRKVGRELLYCAMPVRSGANFHFVEWNLSTILSPGKSLMQRSTIIAKCLLNSNMYTRLEDAESRVNQVFEKSFPGQDFFAWNLNVDDDAAENVIQTVGKAISISVDLLILDLWDEMPDRVKDAHRRRLW